MDCVVNLFKLDTKPERLLAGVIQGKAGARPVQGQCKAAARPLAGWHCTGIAGALHSPWSASTAKIIRLCCTKTPQPCRPPLASHGLSAGLSREGTLQFRSLDWGHLTGEACALG